VVLFSLQKMIICGTETSRSSEMTMDSS
jgi:hypothetical protein